jgi:hypothetical protein
MGIAFCMGGAIAFAAGCKSNTGPAPVPPPPTPLAAAARGCDVLPGIKLALEPGSHDIHCTEHPKHSPTCNPCPSCKPTTTQAVGKAAEAPNAIAGTQTCYEGVLLRGCLDCGDVDGGCADPDKQCCGEVRFPIQEMALVFVDNAGGKTYFKHLRNVDGTPLDEHKAFHVDITDMDGMYDEIRIRWRGKDNDTCRDARADSGHCP